ncbi:MAG: alpha/beta hydrolase [Bacteroidetes bacterium]|nr:MAG: alpha/beta hydrolase [Bacteroidota bacterium]
MPIREFSRMSHEGFKVYGKEWSVKSPKAVICLVHGLGEHCNRYNHFAEFFNQNNIGVLAFDLPGHGRTENKPGHGSLDMFLAEVAQLLAEAKQRYPNVPVFLYGHSMGGNIVLNYTLRRNPVINGVIASGPWIRLPKPPPFLIVFLGRLLSKITPQLVLATELDGTKVSRDPEVVKAYLNDPLVHAKASALMGATMMDAAKWLDNYSGKMPVPTLIMHGDADELTSVEGSRAFAARVSGDVTMKVWPGLYHEIHNEPEKQQVFEYTLNWIKTHLG